MEVLSTDVVVVGAGLSGLVAAQHLQRGGLSTVVVEGRDVVGASGGATGAVADHRRLLELARQAGLRARRVRGDGRRVEMAGGRRLEFGDGSYSADSRLDVEVRRALARLDWMAAETDATAPWRTAQAQVRDGRTLQQWLDAKVPSPAARTRLATLFQAVWGAHPSGVSLLHALAVAAGAGGMTAVVQAATAPTYAIPGGTEELRRRLASQLGPSLHTGAVVRSITQERRGVVVAADGVEIRARRGVVVAVPLAATRAIDFGDSVPASRVQLAQSALQSGPGPVVCTAPSALWRRGGRSGHVVADGAGVAYPLGTAPDGRAVMIVNATGGDSAKDAVAAWLGERVAAGLVVDATDSPGWMGGGSPTLMPPGVLSRVGPALRSPHGSVVWAGSETATSWAGFAEGSIEAGLRAAEELGSRLSSATGVA